VDVDEVKGKELVMGGGYVISGLDVGSAAARVLARMLKGARNPNRRMIDDWTK
jgi:hypothetical protein